MTGSAGSVGRSEAPDRLSALGRGAADFPEELIPSAEIAFRTLVEQTPAATHISRLDRSASTIYISPQIETMTGYKPEEWVADHDLWTKLVHPDDLARLLVAKAKHVATGRPFSEEYRMIARGGSTVWVTAESRIIKDKHGQPIASQRIILDITDRMRVYEQLQNTLEIKDRLTLELAGAQAESGIHALLAALSARDGYTSEHSEAVVQLVERVTRHIGLTPAEVASARKVALLHDIGKIGVPDSVLRKRGALDAREWRVMREHPVIGARIVESIPGLEKLAPAIRAEHERWDGQGYPDGLVGNAIPLASRIAFVCDAYHAMVSNRPYRKAMPEAMARTELRMNAGSQFDPAVVDALLAILDEEEPLGQGGDPRPIRVLLVDDDPSTREILRFTLEGETLFDVIGGAGNGVEALAIAGSEHPDAIVIDIAMPVMGGLEAIRAIRQSCTETKIVVFTASDSKSSFDEARRLGADICLGKGVSLTEIDRSLRALFPSRATSR